MTIYSNIIESQNVIWPKIPKKKKNRTCGIVSCKVKFRPNLWTLVLTNWIWRFGLLAAADPAIYPRLLKSSSVCTTNHSHLTYCHSESHTLLGYLWGEIKAVYKKTSAVRRRLKINCRSLHLLEDITVQTTRRGSRPKLASRMTKLLLCITQYIKGCSFRGFKSIFDIC